MKKLVQLKNKNNENIDPINKDYEKRIQELEIKNNNLISIINNLKGKVLWSNDEPTKNFDTQDVENSNTNYNTIEIVYMLTNYSGYHYRKSTGRIPYKQYEKVQIEVLDYDGNKGITTFRRFVTMKDKASFNISNCEKNYTVGSTTDNSYCIPLYIIGYNT